MPRQLKRRVRFHTHHTFSSTSCYDNSCFTSITFTSITFTIMLRFQLLHSTLCHCRSYLSFHSSGLPSSISPYYILNLKLLLLRHTLSLVDSTSSCNQPVSGSISTPYHHIPTFAFCFIFCVPPRTYCNRSTNFKYRTTCLTYDYDNSPQPTAMTIARHSPIYN